MDLFKQATTDRTDEKRKTTDIFGSDLATTDVTDERRKTRDNFLTTDGTDEKSKTTYIFEYSQASYY